MGFRNSSNYNKKYKFKLKIPKFCDENGFHYKESSTGEIILEMCPACGKQDFKLYVSEETGVGQCKHASCEWVEGVSPMTLIRTLLDCSKKEAFEICYEVPEQKPRRSLFDDDPNYVEEEEPAYVKQKQEVPTIELPTGSVDLDKELHSEAWNYLIGRGYTDDIINRLSLKVLPFSDYKQAWAALQKKGLTMDQIKLNIRYINRIIFPLYVNSEIKGYIARDFTGLVDKKWKVLNSAGKFRSEFFWNYDNVKNNQDCIVICEGISDAIKCGVDRSVALLGPPSENQLNLIANIGPKKVVICLDVGTEQLQNFIYEKLVLDMAGNVFVVDVPPILYQKENLLTDNIISAIKETYPDLNEYDQQMMVIPFENFHDVKVKFKHKWFKLTDDEYILLEKFIKTAQYKDAGDYSIDEMEAFIQNAPKFEKKIVPKLAKID